MNLLQASVGGKGKGLNNGIQFEEQNFSGHESVHMKSKRRCRIHLNNKVRKETVYGCKTCDVHLCKDGCHFTYHREQND
jgi:hypothetical protein